MAIIEGTLLDQGGAVYNAGSSSNAAEGDVKFASGASMSAASATLTAPAGTFQSTDVGKVIWVPGAGPSGKTLSHLDDTRVGYEDYVTIAAYVSSSQVTLSKAASTSVSGKTIGFGTSDTAALQGKVDTAAAAGGGEVLLRPGRVYLSRNLIMRPGVTLNLNGSTLIRPANNGAWRSVSVPEVNDGRWGGTVDSAPVTVRNGTLDGNRGNQGAAAVEGAHLMFFDADPAQAGRLRVNVENMILQQSSAEGLTFFRNVDIAITNLRVTDCHRSALVARGGYSRLRVDRFMAGAVTQGSGIELKLYESGAEGYGGSTGLDAQLNSLWLQGGFDVGLQPGGVVIADNVICRRPGFLLAGLGSTVRISNSEFTVGTFAGAGANGNRIVFPNDVTLSNCTFTVEPEVPNAGTPFNLAGVRVAFRAGATPANQKLRLIDCAFKLGPGVKSSDVTYGIWVEEDALTLNNELLVEGCDIPTSFDVGLYAHYGLRATVRNSRLRATKPFHWNANEGGSGIDLTIDDVDVRGAGFYMAAGDGYPGSGLKRIEHRNTHIDEADAGVTSAGGFDATTYVGGRVLRVTQSPVGRLVGMPGDVAELETPAPGEVWRWVCTQTYSLADASVWKAEPALST